MASVFCNKCSEEIEIPEGRRSPFITCPKCRAAVPVGTQAARPAAPARPSAPARPPAAPSANASYTPPPPAPANASYTPPPPASPSAGGAASSPPAPAGAETLPEMMKANKRVAGQPCSVCARPINLGEQIHNCPKCHSINHDACWRQSGGCTSISCRSGQAPVAATAAGGAYEPPAPRGSTAPDSANMIPCRWCKEPIMRGARKCKHCNEFQRDEDREMNKKVYDDEEALSVTDWIGVLCCPIIAFIQGIVYTAQGRPKGKRLMLYSAIAMFLGALSRAGN